MKTLRAGRAAISVPVHLVTSEELDDWLGGQPAISQEWLQANEFKGTPGSLCVVPGDNGSIACAVVGVAAEFTTWSLAGAASSLPAADYHLATEPGDFDCRRLALGWVLAGYDFDRYRSDAGNVAAPAVLSVPADVHDAVVKYARAASLVRDLINTPAEDLPPAKLAAAAQSLADEFGASCSVVSGDDLLEQNFPAVHAVGRAAQHAPCIAHVQWGDESHPCIALVGKGVCFDSGGLDIKAASGMRLMKKDMGGAAHAIGIARLVMSHALPVRLHLIVPAVENAIAGNAYRPGDIVATRRGLNIEVDNTDAEGRIILSDALALACEQNPEVIVDFATLTGAARVALGTELPAMFCNNDDLANGILEHGAAHDDPVWRLPLHQPYHDLIKSKVADVLNAGTTPFGGAITAALFLERFVDQSIPWAHFDVMAWNAGAKPGRPEGGEAMGVRAVFDYLQNRYA